MPKTLYYSEQVIPSLINEANTDLKFFISHFQGIERVVFVGNYLCDNVLSTQMLSYAMEYWSQGSIRALFLRHEGYFGALGSMIMKLEEEMATESGKEDDYKRSDSE